MNNLSFIEQQFPVSKVSKEAYKERKAAQSQTLTGLGKWWGRKPLILVRASIVGMLMPVSNDPKKDRDIFLKILTMDDDGLSERKSKGIVAAKIYENLNEEEKEEYFVIDAKGKVKYKSGVSNIVKQQHQKIVFSQLSYDDKISYCDRPEKIKGPNEQAWNEINSHLGTTANDIQSLVDQLGVKQFGHKPKVGDCFAGGGSIPFEAARIGCNTYASDLNPVATLLTWSGINIVGTTEKKLDKIKLVQENAYNDVVKEIDTWGIETNEIGWNAEAYLYCVEVRSPSSGYMVPLAPSWIISEKYKVIATLIPDHKNKKFDIQIVENANKESFKQAKNGTVKNSRVIDPITGEDIAITTIRGDKKNDVSSLRLWDEDDIKPRQEDVFQERLYCIRYSDENGSRRYITPDENDHKREAKVLELLESKIKDWQNKGYIPDNIIERGYNTDQPLRERGWRYWHQLFNPRQLLINGLMAEKSLQLSYGDNQQVAYALLNMGSYADWNSKLCRWDVSMSSGGGVGMIKQTFSNQALNSMYNYVARSVKSSPVKMLKNLKTSSINNTNTLIETKDARTVTQKSDIWITDPPYADAVNYHELSDFFLAWYEKNLSQAFPSWYSNSKKALAVQGTEYDFKRSMIDIYSNLTKHMPDNGLQMVQFTHQDPSVWANLAMILWASGLRVTAAWTITTETATAMRTGNYVQGTVLLVLRKRLEKETAFISEIYSEIEDEVKEQLDQMTTLDDKEDPNFADTDYQLAAYAAALRVLTWYDIDGYDVEHELFREKAKGEKNKFEEMIDKAVEIATNHLIPDGIDKMYWRELSAQERLYFKGLELEKHGEMRSGAYQELARGFGVRDYQSLQAGNSANAIRFKTPSEFKKSNLNSGDFGDTTLRQLLFSVYEVTRTEELSEGLNYLRAEVPNYWNKRKLLIAMLDYVIRFESIEHMSHWQDDVASAKLLAGAIQNDTPGA